MTNPTAPVDDRSRPGKRAFGAARVVLAGVVHRDPSGADRLWRFLEARGPDGVSIELSRYSLSFRRSRRDGLKAAFDKNLRELAEESGRDASEKFYENGHLRAVRAAIDVPYEYEVASTFCRRHGLPLELADLSSSSQRHLPALEELVSKENVRRLLAEPDVDPCLEAERQRSIARRLLRGRPLEARSWPVESDEENEAREEHMARIIRKAIEDVDASRWIHIGGWQHLLWVDGRRTLYTRLSTLDPDRVIV